MTMSYNLFNMEELSLQPESYLDETFGLSADILATDLNVDGSILGMGFGPAEGNKPSSLHQPSEPLNDLFTDQPYGDRDPFGDEWMETVDLSSLLDNNIIQLPTTATEVHLEEHVQPPVISIPAVKPDPEVRKEGMKAAAYDLLKALLTGTSVDTSPTVESSPALPPFEAEVPDLSILADSFIESGSSVDNSAIEDLLGLPTDSSMIIDGVVEIKPEINRSLPSPAGLATRDDTDSVSILSSGPSSPESSVSFYTIDSSQLSDSSNLSSGDKSSQITDYDFQVSKSIKKSSHGKEKSGASPYNSEPVLDKKGRKKVQNKNAATRYRVKKRDEKESLQQQEGHLSDKNKQLKEKVESLQREIKYMKELMNEIYKAKKSKI